MQSTVEVQNAAMQVEESERYTSPANCWLMTPVLQEIVIGNLHLVAGTAAVAIDSVLLLLLLNPILVWSMQQGIARS